MTTERTWRWDGGDALVGWDYRPMQRSDGRLVPLVLEAPEARRAWLRGLLERLPVLLGDFAYPTKANVAVRGMGEDACVVDWRSHGAAASLLEFVGRTDGVHHVHVDLTLTCQGRDLEPLEIVRGGGLFVSFELTESGALNTAADDPVYLQVHLNVDIYSPRTLGPVRDNSLLAALNGPRLAGFLERIEQDVPAQLVEIDEESYHGMVGPRGFTAPAAAPTDA